MRTALIALALLLCAGPGLAQDEPVRLSGAQLAALELEQAPMRGSEGALRVVVISDFQCPACGRAHPVMERIAREFGESIELRYYGIAGPAHEWARQAFVAARCLGEQDREHFWKAADYFFENARGIDAGRMDARVLQLARQLDADPGAFTKCYDSPRYFEQVDDNLKSAVGAGVRATPSYLIGEKLISGSRSFEALSERINQALQPEPEKAGLLERMGFGKE